MIIFLLKRLTRKAAVFDNKKLDWLSGQHIVKSESKDLLDSIRLLKPDWAFDGLSDDYLCSSNITIEG